jgi:hypothetical protein
MEDPYSKYIMKCSTFRSTVIQGGFSGEMVKALTFHVTPQTLFLNNAYLFASKSIFTCIYNDAGKVSQLALPCLSVTTHEPISTFYYTSILRSAVDMTTHSNFD